MKSQGLLGTSDETHRPTASKAERLKYIRSAYAQAKQKIEKDEKAAASSVSAMPKRLVTAIPRKSPPTNTYKSSTCC